MNKRENNNNKRDDNGERERDNSLFFEREINQPRALFIWKRGE